MSKAAYTLPGTAPGVAARASRAAPPLSKPELSRLILTGTAALASVVMIGWMLLAHLFGPGGVTADLLARSFGPPRGASGDLAFLDEDLRAIAGPGASAPLDRRQFEQDLDRFLEGRRRGAVVIYLSAAGVSSPESDAARAAFLAEDGTPRARDTLIPADELIGLIGDRLREHNAQALLILDAAQVGSDRDLGVFGNAFVDRLESMVKDDGPLVVLTSCAPGQLSWTSEAARRSVFAHYVAEGLAGKAAEHGRVSVGSLYRYVRAGVSDWVARQRGGAIQTPLLIGNTRLTFNLPKLAHVPQPAANEVTKEAEAFWKSLEARWAERDALARTHPYRHAPLPWRLYQETLLRAERLARAGRFAEAVGAIESIDRRGLKGQIESLAPGRSSLRPWSLAQLEARIASAPDGAGPLAAERDRYTLAIERLIGAPASPQPPAREGTGAEPPAPAVNETPAEQPKAPAVAEDVAEPKSGGGGGGGGDSPQTPEDAAEPAPAKPAEPAPTAPSEPAKATTTPTTAPAPGRDPVASLTSDSLREIPDYVEGQLPLWYAAFEARGGESAALRDARLGLIRTAVAVRSLAEAAADDPDVTRWVRGPVEEGDVLRRRGQDFLFSGDASLFGPADHDLREAGRLYEEAARLADDARKALDLVRRLQDELPYYGEWLARRNDGPSPNMSALLDLGADLSDRLLADSVRPDRVRDWNHQIVELTDDARKRLDDLAAEFRAAVQDALVGGSRWREIDALLRVPTIPARDRLALLAKVGSSELSPPLGAGDVDPATPDAEAPPDPIFLDRALALAHLELGLLRIAGIEVGDLSDEYDRAREARHGNPERLLDNLDRFSGRVRRIRAALLGREDRGDDPSRRPSESPDGPDLLAAERLARILPAADAGDIRPGSDPTRAAAERRVDELLVWHARRLVLDYAPRHAEGLLDRVRGRGVRREQAEVRAEARAVAEAGMTVAMLGRDGSSADSRGRVGVRVAGEGDLPEGHAVILFAHDPEIPLGVRSLGDDPESALVPVPLGRGRSVERSFMLVRDSALQVVPGVFYRGRVLSSAPRLRIDAPDDLVKIQIHQAKTEERIGRDVYRFRDQFADNARVAYLHPSGYFDYRLTFTNTTSEPLDVYVTRQTGAGLPRIDRLSLKADGTTSLEGRVLNADVDFDKPLLLTVGAHEGDEAGRRLSEPLQVEFRKLHMKPFIQVRPGYRSDGRFREFRLNVGNFGDPVPVPASVRVTIFPADFVAERTPSSMLIPSDQQRTFIYRVSTEIDELSYTVEAEGEVVFDKVPFPLRPMAAPPAPAPGAAPPGAAGFAPPPQ